ncbi:MAG: hypothetical protein GXN93_01145 [Candidatus Diapherotrites archaeon]|nr:hypothetical protein [Candidatus Diapherotrites archaeon]
MRGFTNTMSTLILFIGAVLAVSLAVSAMTVMLKEIHNAMNQKTEVQTLKTLTVLEFITGSGDGNYMWFYIKNIGKTNLDVNQFDVFVDTKMVGVCNEGNVICIDQNGDYTLVPGEVLEINFPYPATSGAYTVKAVSQYGTSVEGQVVVP